MVIGRMIIVKITRMMMMMMMMRRRRRRRRRRNRVGNLSLRVVRADCLRLTTGLRGRCGGWSMTP
jgi:preprotein translocase subunit YajC